MYPGLKKLDARLAMFEFAAGPNPTIADAYLVPVCYMFQAPSFLDGFPPESLAPFPNIARIKVRILEHHAFAPLASDHGHHGLILVQYY